MTCEKNIIQNETLNALQEWIEKAFIDLNA